MYIDWDVFLDPAYIIHLFLIALMAAPVAAVLAHRWLPNRPFVASIAAILAIALIEIVISVGWREVESRQRIERARIEFGPDRSEYIERRFGFTTAYGFRYSLREWSSRSSIGFSQMIEPFDWFQRAILALPFWIPASIATSWMVVRRRRAIAHTT